MEIVRHTSDDFMLIAGDDLLAVPMIAIGAKGSIAVLPNLFPDRFSNMIRAALQNDFETARRLLLDFTDLNPLLYAEGNPVGAKAVLSLMGACEPYVRLPLAEASKELVSKLKAALDKMAVAEKK
jgi:4-hydroxy-tetrahydrodipicolinate synthase